MSDQNTDINALIAQQIKQALSQVQTAMPQPAGIMPPMGAPGMAAAPAQANFQGQSVLNPTGWMLPIEAEISGMSVTIYLQFPAELFPQYQQVVLQLVNMGYPVKGYQKNNGGWGNNSGGYGGGFNRGGYNRGGFSRGGFGR